MPEVIDAVARARIEKHEAVCREIYIGHDAAFKRNDIAHKELNKCLRGIHSEALSRWKWLIALIISTLLAMIGGMVMLMAELAKVNGGPML